MEAKTINRKTREKIIKNSCKKLETVINENLWPIEIPTSIHVEGNQGTKITFIIKTKKHIK